MVPLGTAQLRRYLVLAWRLLALQALESPTLPPLRSEHPAEKQLILAVTQPLRWGRFRPARQGSMSGGWFRPG